GAGAAARPGLATVERADVLEGGDAGVEGARAEQEQGDVGPLRAEGAHGGRSDFGSDPARVAERDRDGEGHPAGYKRLSCTKVFARSSSSTRSTCFCCVSCSSICDLISSNAQLPAG